MLVILGEVVKTSSTSGIANPITDGLLIQIVGSIPALKILGLLIVVLFTLFMILTENSGNTIVTNLTYGSPNEATITSDEDSFRSVEEETETQVEDGANVGSVEEETVVSEICDDNIDNDGDGLADINDLDCKVTNAAPIADAGDDKEVNFGSQISLDGGASSDPDGELKSYLWTHIDGYNLHLGNEIPIRLEDASTPTPTVIPTEDVNSVHSFELTVTDSEGQADTDELKVNVISETTPVAEAAVIGSVEIGSTVTLDGTASYDPDGEIESYVWKLMDEGTCYASGEAFISDSILTLSEVENSIRGMNSAIATFVPGANGPVRYALQLEVTDNDGKVDYDRVSVKTPLSDPEKDYCLAGSTEMSRYIPSPGPVSVDTEDTTPSDRESDTPSDPSSSTTEVPKNPKLGIKSDTPSDPSSSTTEVPKNPKLGTKTFTNTLYGINTIYPSDWQIDEIDSVPNDDLIEVAHIFPSPSIRESVDIGIDRRAPSNLTLEGYLQFTLDNYRYYYGGINVTESVSNSRDANRTAYKLVFTSNDGTTQVMETGFIVEDRVYYVTYTASPENYLAYLPEVQKIANNIRLAN